MDENSIAQKIVDCDKTNFFLSTVFTNDEKANNRTFSGSMRSNLIILFVFFFLNHFFLKSHVPRAHLNGTLRTHFSFRPAKKWSINVSYFLMRSSKWENSNTSNTFFSSRHLMRRLIFGFVLLCFLCTFLPLYFSRMYVTNNVQLVAIITVFIVIQRVVCHGANEK